MMFKIFLISAFIAASASAGWVWKDDKNIPSGARFRRMAIPAPQFSNIGIPGFPNFPASLGLPGMPDFANLFPHIEIPEIKFPEIKMPEIKMPEIKIPEIKMPEIKMPDLKFISREEILSHKEPGYTGVSIVTKSDGSTEVTKNINGKIETHTYPAGSSNTKAFSIVAAASNN